MQFVLHECRDLGLLEGMWAPPCPHGEGKKQETMSFNGWKRFQFIWWKDPFFLFCFCFSVSFFGLKRETLWDYSKAILFAKKESQRWDSLRTASPHVRVTRWILFSALCRQRSWLIKWAFGPREMRCWELALGREFLLLIRDSSSFFRDLALAVTMVPGSVSQNRKEWVRLALVNSELQTRDLFCIWAENLGFWMSKVVKDNPLINFGQLTCTSSLVFQITLYFHPFSHILQHCKSVLELRPLRWAGTVMPKQWLYPRCKWSVWRASINLRKTEAPKSSQIHLTSISGGDGTRKSTFVTSFQIILTWPGRPPVSRQEIGGHWTPNPLL